VVQWRPQLGSDMLVVPTFSEGGSAGNRAGWPGSRDRLGSGGGDGSGRDSGVDQRYAM